MVCELGLDVVTFPFRGRVREMIVGPVIGVRPGLERRWFRWFVAHAIGHHVLHVGNRFRMESWQWISNAKAERQAEEFAAWLLGGPEGPQGSANELGIPPEKIGLVGELRQDRLRRGAQEAKPPGPRRAMGRVIGADGVSG